MKLPHWLLALSLLSLTACSTTTTTDTANRAAPVPARLPKDAPETVIVTYHIIAGRELEFPALLDRAWGIYRKHHLVQSQPHIIVRDHEDDGKIQFVEIFTWVNHAAPANAPEEVQNIWKEEMAGCEARNGRRPLEGGEVQLLTP